MKAKNQQLPKQPGIYRFLDKDGSLLYIGKAKNLNSRVASYFAKTADLSPAKQLMVGKIKKIEYTIVANEIDALLLEANLIKKYQPPYNIDLKDDKSWLYLKITKDRWPQLIALRQTDKKFKQPGKLFGPYTSAGSVRQTLKTLRKIFPYFTKNGPLVELGSKTGSKLHLGRYLSNEPINNSDWLEKIKDIENFLSGRGRQIQKKLEQQMRRLAQAKKFEQAAKFRDQLLVLNKILTKQQVIFRQAVNEDYFGLAQNNSRTVVCLLKVREGKLLDQENFSFKTPAELSDQEILEQFAEKYYRQTNNKKITIVAPVKLKTELPLLVPQKGGKKKLLKLAEENADKYLNSLKASFEKKLNRSEQQLKILKDILKLKEIPKRIEGYDISNIQGLLAVGSMVVATDGQMDKSQYRKFKIKTVKGANDPKMMAEVISRRLKNSWPKPDLLLIDGGLTQLNAVWQILSKTKQNIPVISLAKKQEEIYLPGQKLPLKLPKFSPALQLLQTIRDEAHRFGISYHRQLRNKKALK